MGIMESFYGLAIVLFPILLADAINPVLLAGVLYGLGSHRPMINSWMIILSFFVSYFLSGVAIALVFEEIVEIFHLPHGFDYAIEFVVALLLIAIGWSQLRSGDTHPEERLKHESSMSLWDAGMLGLQVNFVGLPFAIPYLAAIDQILKAQISAAASVVVLLVYNILYVSPFVAMIAIKWCFGEQSKPILEGFNRWMHTLSVKYLPWIFFVLALLLLEDCISFFLGYREYSFLSHY